LEGQDSIRYDFSLSPISKWQDMRGEKREIFFVENGKCNKATVATESEWTCAIRRMVKRKKWML
jgi:hypothetical protein